MAGLSFLPNLKDSEMIPLDKSNKPPIFLNILPGVQNNPITLEEEVEGGDFFIFFFIFDLRARGENTCDLIPRDHFSPSDGLFCRRSFFTGT